VLDARIVGDKHLKLRLTLPQGSEAIDAIAFGYVGGASMSSAVVEGAALQLAYRLEVNEYRGSARVQLNCQHLKLA
jgi:single-stranded-DNA-specific exonuclease